MKRYLNLLFILFVIIFMFFYETPKIYAITCSKQTSTTQRRFTATGYGPNASSAQFNCCNTVVINAATSAGCSGSTSYACGDAGGAAQQDLTTGQWKYSCFRNANCPVYTSWTCQATTCNGCLYDSGVSCTTTVGSCHYSSAVNSSACGSSCVCSAVNGVCGTSAFACSKGTSGSNVNGTSSYTWNCSGTCGGSTVPCTLSKTAPPPSCTSGQANPHYECSGTACTSVSTCGTNSCTGPADTTSCGGGPICMLNRNIKNNQQI